MNAPHDPDTLEGRLRQALGHRAAATTVGEPHLAPQADDEGGHGADADASATPKVIALVASPAPPRRTTRRWARPAVAAAAALVVLATGLFATGRLTSDTDQTTAGTPSDPDPTQATDAPQDPGTSGSTSACGSELPFAFPVPDGFEGPVAGPVTDEMAENDMWNGTVLRWQGEGGTIDVTWPPHPPIDSSSYDETGGVPIKPQLIEGQVTPANGQVTQTLDAYSDDLGEGPCVGLTVTVTTPDEASTAAVLDHVEVGLLGPDGVLPGPREPLVASETSAETLPSASPCEESPTPLQSGTGEGQGVHPNPEDALLVYLATRTSIAIDGYEKLALPDGSYGYVSRADSDPNFNVLVVHVVRSGDGWAVESWESSGC